MLFVLLHLSAISYDTIVFCGHKLSKLDSKEIRWAEYAYMNIHIPLNYRSS